MSELHLHSQLRWGQSLDETVACQLALYSWRHAAIGSARQALYFVGQLTEGLTRPSVPVVQLCSQEIHSPEAPESSLKCPNQRLVVPSIFGIQQHKAVYSVISQTHCQF